MFTKLILFVALVAPLASALTLYAPDKATNGGTILVKWDSSADDPISWSLYLFHPSFHDSLAIDNNVDPSLQQKTVPLPAVPVADGYTLRAVNIGDVDDVYATSPTFSIGAASSDASSATSPLSSVSRRSTTSTSTSTSRISSLTTRSSTTTNASPSTTTTGTSSTDSIPTASSFSAAPRRIDFKTGGMAAAVLAIGVILTL